MTKSDKRDPMEPFDDISRRHVMTGTSALVLGWSGIAGVSSIKRRDKPWPVTRWLLSSPDTMQKPPGYSHVVEVTGPGRTIYFAGQLGIDKSGKMGSDAREQMEIAFQNVKAALEFGGRDIFRHRQGQQLHRRYRYQYRSLPRSTGHVPQHVRATGKYSDWCAAAGSARRPFRNRSSCSDAAEVTPGVGQILSSASALAPGGPRCSLLHCVPISWGGMGVFNRAVGTRLPNAKQA